MFVMQKALYVHQSYQLFKAWTFLIFILFCSSSRDQFYFGAHDDYLGQMYLLPSGYERDYLSACFMMFAINKLTSPWSAYNRDVSERRNNNISNLVRNKAKLFQKGIAVIGHQKYRKHV